MTTNTYINVVDPTYLKLAADVMVNGKVKECRGDVETFSKFGVNYAIEVGQDTEHFPLLSSKAIKWHHIVIEMLWFLSGSTNIEILRKFGIRFWDAWADNTGNVPSAYGRYWRSFPSTSGTNDQLKWVIGEISNNPNSRRLVVSAWEPSNAQRSPLPPCHLLFVFNVQDGEISLHLTQRSCDIAIGLPYNIASYSLLLRLVSRFTGLRCGVFSHSIVDAHVYSGGEEHGEYDHTRGLSDQIRTFVQCPLPSPKLSISEDIKTLQDVEELITCDDISHIMSMFKLTEYCPHPPIKFKVLV